MVSSKHIRALMRTARTTGQRRLPETLLQTLLERGYLVLGPAPRKR